MLKEEVVRSVSSFNSFIGNALIQSINYQEVIDTSAYGLLSNADTISKSRSYQKIEEILNALYRRGADHGKIVFNVNNICRTASTVPASSSSSLPPVEKELAKESAMCDISNQNTTPKKLKPISYDSFSSSPTAEATNQKLPLSSPGDNSHAKKDRISNSITNTSSSIIVNDPMNFHISPHKRSAQEPPSGSNIMSGASLVPRTNTSTLRPVPMAQRYNYQHPSLLQSQPIPLDSMHHNQDYRKPIDGSPFPNHSAMISAGSSSNRTSFPVPVGRLKATTMVKKHVDRYVPPTDSKPKQKRKIQQLDHPQIQPHRMAESLQPVKFNFKGVEVVTHVEEEEANTNPSSAKKLRGMPVKQPKVIAINTITKYFVNLSMYGKIIKLGPFESPVLAANAHDRAMIRLKGAKNCNPDDLNYEIQKYAKNSMDTFQEFDALLKSQLFGTSFQHLQVVDFSYLLAQSPRNYYTNTSSVPIMQDRNNASTKLVDYRSSSSSSSSYIENHVGNNEGGDFNPFILKSQSNTITSSSSSSSSSSSNTHSALKAVNCFMVDVQITSSNKPSSKFRAFICDKCAPKANIQRDVAFFQDKFSYSSKELKFSKLHGVVLQSREDPLFEPSSGMDAKFTVIPEQQYSQEDHKLIGLFLQSPKNFNCAHFVKQTTTT